MSEEADEVLNRTSMRKKSQFKFGLHVPKVAPSGSLLSLFVWAIQPHLHHPPVTATGDPQFFKDYYHDQAFNTRVLTYAWGELVTILKFESSEYNQSCTLYLPILA